MQLSSGKVTVRHASEQDLAQPVDGDEKVLVDFLEIGSVAMRQPLQLVHLRLLGLTALGAYVTLYQGYVARRADARDGSRVGSPLEHPA